MQPQASDLLALAATVVARGCRSQYCRYKVFREIIRVQPGRLKETPTPGRSFSAWRTRPLHNCRHGDWSPDIRKARYYLLVKTPSTRTLWQLVEGTDRRAAFTPRW